MSGDREHGVLGRSDRVASSRGPDLESGGGRAALPAFFQAFPFSRKYALISIGYLVLPPEIDSSVARVAVFRFSFKTGAAACLLNALSRGPHHEAKHFRLEHGLGADHVAGHVTCPVRLRLPRRLRWLRLGRLGRH